MLDTVSLIIPMYGGQLAEFLVLLTRERAVTGLVGTLSLAVFASNVFSLIRMVLNRAFRVKARGLIHGFAFDVLAVLILGAVVVILALTTVVLVAVHDLAQHALPLPPLVGLRHGLSLAAIYALGMSMLFVIYRTFPNTRVASRAAAIAAVAVTVLWELARMAFATYVESSGVYGRIYGSFGIFVAALVWIYYSSVIFVLGAELAAVLTERDARHRAIPSP